MTPDELRKLAEETLAALYFVVGPVEHYEDNLKYMMEALLKVQGETRRETIKECAKIADQDYEESKKNILSLLESGKEKR